MPLEIKDPTGRVIAWQCIVIWENAGNTPTNGLRTYVGWKTTDGPLPENYDFSSDTGTPGETISFVGPKAQVNTVAFTLGLEDVAEMLARRRHVYVFGWAEYRDIYPNTEPHRMEFTHEVFANQTPGQPQAAMIEFRHFGPRNRTT
jgi:hypothetical protein